MASRYLARGVHTTRAVFKTTPQSLGFGKDTAGRERVLPTLNVSASARQNLGAEGGAQQKPQQQHARGQAPARAIDRRPRTPKSDRGERGERGVQRSERSERGERGDRRPPAANAAGGTPRRAAPASLPAEFFEGSELAAHEPARPRRQRPGQGQPRTTGGKTGASGRGNKPPRESKGRGMGQRGAANTERRADSPTAGARPQRSYAPTRLAVEVKRDTSPRSLFGATSLLAPSLRGARDPATSFWAKDMEPAKARKADVLRTAGDYSVFTPPRPQGKGEKLAQSIGVWSIGMNRSIPMRRAGAGTDVFKSYLK